MAVSQTDLCNMALSHIGKKAITDITQQNSVEATACRLFYDTVRQDVLQDLDWSFARQVQVLPLHAEDPSNGMSRYQYVLPSKSLAIRGLYSSVEMAREVNYSQGLAVENGAELRVIWSNSLNPYIKFTRDVSSNALFPAKFVQMLTYRLAAELAPTLSLDKKQKPMMELYAGIRAEAMQLDANQFSDNSNKTGLWDEVTGDNSFGLY